MKIVMRNNQGKCLHICKDNFKFAGIPTPVRNRLFTPWIKKYAKQPLSWELIFSLWNEDYREAQYAALGYLQNHHKELKPSDIDNLKYLIINPGGKRLILLTRWLERSLLIIRA